MATARARWGTSVQRLVAGLVACAALLGAAVPPALAQPSSAPSAVPGAWNPAPAVPAGRNYVYMESEPGDPVGRGQTELATSRDALFTSYGGRIEARGAYESWVVGVSYPVENPPPLGEVLVFEPGVFNPMSVQFGITSSCSPNASGWAVIEHMVITDGRVTELDARVEQSCNGLPPLRLEIHWNAADTTLLPGPVRPVPTGLWDVPMPVVVGDNALYLESAPGEPLVAEYGLPSSSFFSGGQVTASLQFPQLLNIFTSFRGWHVLAWLPKFMPQPTVGLYQYDREGSDVTGRLSVSYGNRVCDDEGWYAIDHIELAANGQPSSLVMRFEERCTPGGPPLRGKLVINAPADTPGESAPIGNMELIDHPRGSTTATVRGWALDPDTSRPIQVHVYAAGSSVAVDATAVRPDVATAFRFSNAFHGYTATVAIPPGAQQVCAYGIDVGGRSPNALIGCKPLEGRPFGSLEEVSILESRIRVRGWAIDPGSTSPTGYGITVDGGPMSDGAANRPRPDVAAAFGMGEDHGFDASVTAGPGVHRVCVVAANWYGPESHTPLGCRTINVDGDPIGSLDVVARTGNTVRVAGWAIDPDSPAPAEIHLYVDNAAVAVQASRPRPDVDAAFPAYGPERGFDATLGLPDSGPHTICAWAINSGGPGTNRRLGCRTV